MAHIKKYSYLLIALIYLPSLTNFFSGDDWFHLRISQADSLKHLLNFFSFTPNEQSASFYRPLPTQVLFFILQKFFSLTAEAYYLTGLILFTYTLYLVHRFSNSILRTNHMALVSTIIYGLSASNFTRVYFLSAYQELFLVIFSLLTLINFKTNPQRSVTFFILALLSKETAIVIPALIFLLNYECIIKNKFQNLRYEILISVIYLYLRLFHFGLAAGDSYIWNFSPVKAANTLMWYVLWSFGAPELLVDYVGSGLRLIPRFFTDYPIWWPFIVFPLLLTISSSAWQVINKRPAAKYILFFLITLIPVLFLPSHKFALELGLPLVGFSLALASTFSDRLNVLSYCFLIFFSFTNLSMNYLTFTRHYSVSRGEISKKVMNYFQDNYPNYPEGKQFLFINDAKDNGSLWGQSKQVSQAVSSSDMFKVLYRDNSIKVLYEDIDGREKQNQDTILVSTSQFLRQ